jgi:hypothetical protein
MRRSKTRSQKRRPSRFDSPEMQSSARAGPAKQNRSTRARERCGFDGKLYAAGSALRRRSASRLARHIAPREQRTALVAVQPRVRDAIKEESESLRRGDEAAVSTPALPGPEKGRLVGAASRDSIELPVSHFALVSFLCRVQPDARLMPNAEQREVARLKSVGRSDFFSRRCAWHPNPPGKNDNCRSARRKSCRHRNRTVSATTREVALLGHFFRTFFFSKNGSLAAARQHRGASVHSVRTLQNQRLSSGPMGRAS